MILRLFIYNWYVVCLLINWYQDFCFSIGIVSFLIGINMHFIDTFLIGIIFDLTPHCYRFCFRQKGENIPLLILCFEQKEEKNIFFICFVFNPFVDDWQKGGEEFEFICMFVCMFYIFIKFNWYQKHYLKNIFSFGIKSL